MEETSDSDAHSALRKELCTLLAANNKIFNFVSSIKNDKRLAEKANGEYTHTLRGKETLMAGREVLIV